jgi:hypothetical protein
MAQDYSLIALTEKLVLPLLVFRQRLVRAFRQRLVREPQQDLQRARPELVVPLWRLALAFDAQDGLVEAGEEQMFLA